VSDRRLAHRVPVRLIATYRSSSVTTEGTVTDLSRFGLFFSGVPGDRIGTDASSTCACRTPGCRWPARWRAAMTAASASGSASTGSPTMRAG